MFMCSSMFQSPRQDLLENLRYSVSQEYQKKFEIEKGRFEDQLTQLREDHEAALAELKVCLISLRGSKLARFAANLGFWMNYDGLKKLRISLKFKIFLAENNHEPHQIKMVQKCRV